MAVIMALVLKYFLVEAYKIPTGSMQPTLMGWDSPDPEDPLSAVKDRILVDKISFHLRDPKRFEIVVFRYPLDRSKTFVKRVVGMPGEHLRIAHGDLWTRPSADEPWTILRRPRPVQRSMWKRLVPEEPGVDDEPMWTPERGEWAIDGRSLRARGSGLVRFGSRPYVTDLYQDGYADALRGRVRTRGRQRSGANAVGDLRLDGTVTALPGCREIVVELTEGGRTYAVSLPGPAAAPDATPLVAWSQTASYPLEQGDRLAVGAPWRLPANEPVHIGVQNLDDLVELEVDGEVVLALEVAATTDQRSSVRLAVEGEGADFAELMVQRDVYYTSGDSMVTETAIPEGRYFMLGDNTQDSADSREWRMFTYEVRGPDGPEHVRGNYRQRENPYDDAGHPAGPLRWIRDEWGELRSFPLAQTRWLDTEPWPFVPREMILGRALAVFWPIAPSHDIYRIRWVR